MLLLACCVHPCVFEISVSFRFLVLSCKSRALPGLQSSPSLEELHRLSYTKAARGRARVQSALPSSEEAEALFQLDADLFTPEAVEGMRECVSRGIAVRRQYAVSDVAIFFGHHGCALGAP